MSHKKKWKKNRRANRKRTHVVPTYAQDRHHMCFIGRAWDKSNYGRLLRRNFIRTIPVLIHRELHNHYLVTVPVPSEQLLKVAWEKYLAEKEVVDSYDICRALAWLYVNIPDPEFRQAIQVQIDFFASHL